MSAQDRGMVAVMASYAREHADELRKEREVASRGDEVPERSRSRYVWVGVARARPGRRAAGE
jgi:hypothetical protein